jgi:hypothetical protein
VGARKIVVSIPGEWIGDTREGSAREKKRSIKLFCEDAAAAEFKEGSLDGVFTDPPYFGNVQYAELMDFCYVWLRRLIGKSVAAFAPRSTRNPSELTGNVDMGRGLEHFTDGLSAVFQRAAKGLKPKAPFVFTYHHNDLGAYFPVAAAVLDSGLTCSASLPCPAEMGASIHINGTGSSIIDTVFVCRSTGNVAKRLVADSQGGIAAMVQEDIRKLVSGGVRPTMGDLRCITFGHMIRLAIWHLRRGWDKERPAAARLGTVRDWIAGLGDVSSILKEIDLMPTPGKAAQGTLV